jgi:acyl carrier protein
MVTQKVIAIIADAAKAPAETITLDRSLAELGIDSLRGLGMICDLENEFDLSIPNPFSLGLRTVGDVVSGVEKLLQESAQKAAG